MNLKQLICIIWDSGVSTSEALEGFSKAEIKMMDDFIRINPTVFQDGIEEDSIWDEILEHEEAGRLIQKMIDIQEGTCTAFRRKEYDVDYE